MKISDYIERLEYLKHVYGDLDLFEVSDYGEILKAVDTYPRPRISKLYYQNCDGFVELYEGDVDLADEELYDIDLSKSVTLGVII